MKVKFRPFPEIYPPLGGQGGKTTGTYVII
jgi:hypothetical protein